MANQIYLFTGDSWHVMERQLQSGVEQSIQQFDPEKLLNTEVGGLCKYFVELYFMNLPEIKVSDISVQQREVYIETQDRYSSTRIGSLPRKILGTEFEVHIPYEGEQKLFYLQPTTYNSSPPQAQVNPEYLSIRIQGVNLEAQKVRAQIDQTISQIDQYLSWLQPSIDAWNTNLPQIVAGRFEARRRKLIHDRTAVSDLGFKIRDNPGAAKTFSAPEVRRKIVPTLPSSSSGSWKAEPTLPEELYEYILKVIGDAAVMMERSPSAFQTLGEEALRDQVLFLLNGHFEGTATSETFNKKGKTDILIRSLNKNIFIGECKFWGGAQVLANTIDQILGYVSWRDTKAAIIIFNRKKDFSKVLEQIQPTVEAHPNCKRFVTRFDETQFRFVFRQRDDANREMILTVILFDVPKP